MDSRQTRGRQRIPMRLIENLDDLYATFSKRRRGLFKKACELSTLCGVDVGIIIFSPTNNPFSLWHPSMNSVIARYRNPSQQLDNETWAADNITRERVRVFNGGLDEVLDQKEHMNEEDKNQDEINQTREKVWWEQVPLGSLQKNQASEWRKWFEDIITKIQICTHELENESLGSTVVYTSGLPSTFSHVFLPNPSMGMMGPSPPPFQYQCHPFTSGSSLFSQFQGSLGYLPPHAGDLYRGGSMAAPPEALPPSGSGDGINIFPSQHYQHSDGGHHQFTSGASLFSQFRNSYNYIPMQLTQGSASSGTSVGHSQDYPHLNMQHPTIGGTSFFEHFPGQFNYLPQEGQDPSSEPSTSHARTGAHYRGNNP